MLNHMCHLNVSFNFLCYEQYFDLQLELNVDSWLLYNLCS